MTTHRPCFTAAPARCTVLNMPLYAEISDRGRAICIHTSIQKHAGWNRTGPDAAKHRHRTEYLCGIQKCHLSEVFERQNSKAK